MRYSVSGVAILERRPHQRQTQPAFDVLALAQAFVEMAQAGRIGRVGKGDGGQRVTTDHRRGAIAHRIAAKDVGRADVAQLGLLADAHHVAMFVDQPAGRIADADMGIGVQMDHMQRQFFRQPAVIGIEEGDILPPRGQNARVARAGQPPVGLRQDADARIIKPGADRHRAVLAAIVDNQQLEIAIGLRQHRLHRLRHIALDVVDRHNDGDFGVGRVHGVSSGKQAQAQAGGHGKGGKAGGKGGDAPAGLGEKGARG
jgi:hypothetical protein